jgi:4-hydroxy-tetrahydrodipicolinate synthase
LEGFGRVLTAMVTPFDKNLNVDYDKAAALAERLVKSGSDGLVVAGTTGESPTLSKEEKLQLFKVVVNAVGGKASVIAGTGSYSTRDSIELTREAEKKGVDGLMLVAPYYNKPPQEGLYEHFKSIAENTMLPIIVYNVPGRTSVNILPDTVRRLAQVKNIVAIKEASGDLNQVSEIRMLTPGDFLIYSGDDSMTLPILSIGGTGVISVASHVAGQGIKAMMDAYFSGNVRRASELHLKLFPIFKGLFLTTNPIPVKAALRLAGFDAGSVRQPLVDLSQNGIDRLKELMENAGIL